MTKVNLYNCPIPLYEAIYKWCTENLTYPVEYKWHHQPSQGSGKYWVELSPSALSLFILKWGGELQ